MNAQYYLHEVAGHDIAQGKEELRSRKSVTLSACERAVMEKVWKPHTYGTSIFSLAGAIHNLCKDGRLRKEKAIAFVREKERSRKPQHLDAEFFQNFKAEMEELPRRMETLETMFIIAFRGMKLKLPSA